MSWVRRWGRAIAVTLVASVACVLLGLWQLDRREQRLARIAEVEGNYDAAPVALGSVLGSPRAPLPAGEQYTPVAVSGEYAPDSTLLVRNRPLDGAYGYLVLTPLVLDGADAPGGGGPAVLVVDRGWIPAGPDGSRPAGVPAPPQGRVDVVARLRPPEPADTRTAPAGQVQRVDLDGSVADGLAGSGLDAALVTGAYGQLVAEDPRPAVNPALPPRPPADEGPHLGYSLQWFVFAAGLGAFLVVHGRRVGRDEAATPQEGATARAPRPRRDEDAEDAALDAAEHRAAQHAP